MKDYIFFDLDGTLTDSQEGIINSLQFTLSYYNIKRSNDQLRVFIGPPLLNTFKENFGFDEEKAKEAVVKYREYYATKGLFENKVYDGIEDMLKTLKKANKKLVVATSKPEEFSIKILDYFHLSKYFEYICGSNMDESRGNKAEVIEYAMQKNNLKIENKDRIIMVGDRSNDIIGAHKNQLKAVYVLYGYGNKDEAIKSESDYIVENVKELCNFLLSL